MTGIIRWVALQSLWLHSHRSSRVPPLFPNRNRRMVCDASSKNVDAHHAGRKSENRATEGAEEKETEQRAIRGCSVPRSEAAWQAKDVAKGEQQWISTTHANFSRSRR